MILIVHEGKQVGFSENPKIIEHSVQVVYTQPQQHICLLNSKAFNICAHPADMLQYTKRETVFYIYRDFPPPARVP